MGIMAWIELGFYLIIAMFAAWAGFLSLRNVLDKEYAKYPPFMPSFGKEQEIIVEEIGKILEKSDKPMVIADPGCGSGTLLIHLAKKFPQHSFVGIEWSLPVYLLCKIRCCRYKNMTIIKKSFFDVSFETYDIITCFLMWPLMHDFGEKIKSECKKETIVFSNTFTFNNLNLVKTYETPKKSFVQNVYLYDLKNT